MEKSTQWGADLQEKVDTTGKRWLAGDSSDVPERGRLVVDAGGTPVGIFRVDGELYAYLNVCVHEGGPACQGRIVPRVREVLNDKKEALALDFDESDMHVCCPWHGFEYSIKTGRHAGVDSLSLRAFPVSEEDGKVYVTV
jgi:nitrite reductase/ring-hydroxylating ferredoxin subunit